MQPDDANERLLVDRGPLRVLFLIGHCAGRKADQGGSCGGAQA